MQTINNIIQQIVKDQIPLTPQAHNELLENNRTLYAALLNVPGLTDTDAMEIIVRLLAITDHQGKAVEMVNKQMEDRLITNILPNINPNAVWEGFDQLVKQKINNQRTANWIKRYILESPQLLKWAVAFRNKLAKYLRHAMGKHTTQNCIHFIQKETIEGHQQDYLYKNLYKYEGAYSKNQLAEIFQFIFKQKITYTLPEFIAYGQAKTDLKAAKGLPYQVIKGLSRTYHPKTKKVKLKRWSKKFGSKREITVGKELEATNQMGLAGRIRNFYLTGIEPNLLARIEQEAALIPMWNDRVAIVLDCSDSMKGFGARAYNSIAIGTAITEVFKRKTREVKLIRVGNEVDLQETILTGNLALPKTQGASCIAQGVLEALDFEPEVILIISDGYENVEQGDTAQILAGVKQLNLSTKMIHIMPAFTRRESAENRLILGDDEALIVETGEKGMMSLWLHIQFILHPDKVSELLAESLKPILN